MGFYDINIIDDNIISITELCARWNLPIQRVVSILQDDKCGVFTVIGIRQGPNN